MWRVLRSLPQAVLSDQSYERKIAGEVRNCTDTDNNANDFVWNSSSSNPQSSSSPFGSLPFSY